MKNSLTVKALLAAGIAMFLALAVPLFSSNLSASPAGAQDTDTSGIEDADGNSSPGIAAESGEAAEAVEIVPGDGFEIPEECVAFEECVNRILDGQLGDTEGELLTDEEWDALEARISAECDPLLPEGADFEGDFDDEDFKAFDECMGYDDFDGEFEDGIDFTDMPNAVFVLTADGEQFIELGDDASAVSITSDGSTVEVEVTGDAVVIDSEMFEEGDIFEDEEFAACEILLPEGIDMDGMAHAVAGVVVSGG